MNRAKTIRQEPRTGPRIDRRLITAFFFLGTLDFYPERSDSSRVRMRRECGCECEWGCVRPAEASGVRRCSRQSGSGGQAVSQSSLSLSPLDYGAPGLRCGRPGLLLRCLVCSLLVTHCRVSGLFTISCLYLSTGLAPRDDISEQQQLRRQRLRVDGAARPYVSGRSQGGVNRDASGLAG